MNDLRPGTGLRLLFAGTPEAAVPSLQALLASRHDVVAVLTRPDAPAGRGRRVVRSPVGALADEAGIPVLTPRRPSEPAFLDALRALAPDCCAIVAYGALVPRAALDVPRFGWVNLHFSLLPAWRGAAPVQAAIRAGDPITGATTFRLEEGLDTGPVYGVVTEAVGAPDTAGALLGRLADSGAGLLVATVDGIADGTLAPQPQPAEGVSHAPKVTVADAQVDWGVPAAAVDRLVRSVTPEPGAWTTFRAERLGLGPVRPVDPVAGDGPERRVAERRPPGRRPPEFGLPGLGVPELGISGRGVPEFGIPGRSVPELHIPGRSVSDLGVRGGGVPELKPGELYVEKRRVLVGTATAPVVLGEVRPVGRRPMPAPDWARGVRIAAGEALA